MLSPSTIQVVRDSRAVPGAQYLLEVTGVRKEFPGVLALDNVELRLRPGTVHALMGENGAGKSTLMKIVAGIYTPDSGSFKLRNQEIRLRSPLDALENGIAMIHQELNLMNPMTVAENIWIRREPRTSLGFIDHRELRRRTEALFGQLNIRIDPETEVGTLSVANRQMVEIAKAVSYESDVLIMDEPTSALTEREVEHLFEIIRSLKAQGKGIIYITHKMNELFEIADEVSVFRDGRYIATKAAGELTRDDIIRMMVGREISQMFPKATVPIGDVVLRVRDLSLKGVFEGISFDLRAGEILGIAGLVGAGRSNIAETIFGVTPATSGTIEIDGKLVSVASPAIAMRHGMAFLTEDRKETGCFLLLDIQENAQAAALCSDYVRYGFVEEARLSRDCEAMTQALRVKTPDMGEPILNLSGGNQQKVLIARWLLTKPRILILDEPTRGIDVGAKAEIHRMISDLAGQGVAVIMISSEMPEILGMSDRVMTVRQGRTSGILDRAEANQVKIMEMAAQ
ncbi:MULTISPECIES: sugar ABC transporter ATP-binding protein [unclassified Mesorhizobium]|uniref:sugar ABC transporter ATP-binding protein n=1 Tax=unclassified Mesorhizobium TaxID=325217 RepID=UPI000FCB731D|nr:MULTISPECIES: sugar ABC transporter ATP-binding protein [unclassified Mesorhizobium]TGP21563.1 sugar ABC transporter ATP-binding protein [Mesorhizobium sp. M1D.F.Ca.ET.231.01.1.1]TGP29009.1 sugar ABC transporter ATP-binding protein [Mesorhizobium sp. M1D.F.Ca.ET.234.01.1.1]TGS43477.1 sugar ABC transporter ATP-binding protein [Mesorhizobium sp. M1D.F.Ca.ET.184.01.1.1]TGS60024.1 sugar ABC transporter ATP-binding protein [Mesorhizobium sp. M1D.F.Ca.ET.183.01.1.1]